jgi:hypothetical protein
VLKKAGIVVATSAAALLAVSPLAFAGDYNDDNGGGNGHHSRSHKSNNNDDSGSCRQDNRADNHSESRRRGGGGLIDISRNAIQVPVQACNNNIVNNVVVGVLSKNQSAESRNGG